jgi:hypothetical protein
MIIDLDQPVKAWLLDVIENFGTLIENGNDPAVEITNGDIYMEIRLVKAEGLFDRFKMQGEDHEQKQA